MAEDKYQSLMCGVVLRRLHGVCGGGGPEPAAGTGRHGGFRVFRCFFAGAVGRLLLAVAAVPVVVAAESSVTFNVVPSKPAYANADTVILAVSVTIRPDYYLYGNPVGPGGGRPFSLSISQRYQYVRWIEVRKLKAQKVGPPFGDWVWAYRGETWFFCVGVVTLNNKSGMLLSEGSISVEGLVCRDACSLQTFQLPFSIAVAPREYATSHFVDVPAVARLYAVSQHMADIPQSQDP